MNEPIAKTISTSEPWNRALYIILFLVINSFLKGIVLVTAVIQFLHVVIKNETNQFIADFSQGLSNYSYQLTLYVTYISDNKPFPFSAWNNKKPT